MKEQFDKTYDRDTAEVAPALIKDDGSGLLEIVQPEEHVPTNAELFADSQPHNRQYYRAKFRATDKATAQFTAKLSREEYQKTRKPKNADPTKLPTHVIHAIFKKNRMSIRWKQHRVGTVGKTWDLDPNATPKFQLSVYRKVKARRAKRKSSRRATENYNRRVNQIAA